MGPEDALTLDEVQSRINSINAQPPRGLFFDQPSYLEGLVAQVRDSLADADGSNVQHDAAEARMTQISDSELARDGGVELKA